MVQPLLESELAKASRLEALPIPESSDSSLEKSWEKLRATCLGDIVAPVGIARHWEKSNQGQGDGKIVSPECLLQHYL